LIASPGQVDRPGTLGPIERTGSVLTVNRTANFKCRVVRRTINRDALSRRRGQRKRTGKDIRTSLEPRYRSGGIRFNRESPTGIRSLA